MSNYVVSDCKRKLEYFVHLLYHLPKKEQKKKEEYLHMKFSCNSHENMIKNRIPINRRYKSTKRKKQYLKCIHLIDRYYPIFLHFQKIQGRENKKQSAIINMHRHEDKHLPALKNIPVATRHAQTPASKSRVHARPYICT